MGRHQSDLRADLDTLTRLFQSLVANIDSVRQLLDAAPILAAGPDLVVACVVLALLAINQRTALHRDRTERSAIETTASSFAVALSTYDYKDLPSWHDRVVGFATGGFRAEFDQSFAPLKELRATAEISSKGTAADVFIKQVDANSARAFVQVNSTAAGVGGPGQMWATPSSCRS